VVAVTAVFAVPAFSGSGHAAAVIGRTPAALNATPGPGIAPGPVARSAQQKPATGKGKSPIAKGGTPSPQAVPKRGSGSSATPNHSYTPPPAAGPTPDPWTPQNVCGSSFGLLETHSVGAATIYLMYDNGSGQNCVTTMVASSTGKTYLSSTLSVQNGSSHSDSGQWYFYAGPVKAYAPKKCVRWGGAYGSASWTSGWSHCG
jgi:hypothetical protein